jgi:hypothetical protein
LARVAADVRAGEAEHIAEVVHEKESRLYVLLVQNTVHGETDSRFASRVHARILSVGVLRGVLEWCIAASY